MYSKYYQRTIWSWPSYWRYSSWKTYFELQFYHGQNVLCFKIYRRKCSVGNWEKMWYFRFFGFSVFILSKTAFRLLLVSFKKSNEMCPTMSWIWEKSKNENLAKKEVNVKNVSSCVCNTRAVLVCVRIFFQSSCFHWKPFNKYNKPNIFCLFVRFGCVNECAKMPTRILWFNNNNSRDLMNYYYWINEKMISLAKNAPKITNGI